MKVSVDKSISSGIQKGYTDMDTTFSENSAGTNDRESPLACNLLALSQEQRKRHAHVTHEVMSAAQRLQELPDGYAFQFPPQPELLPLLAEFIARERLCCPFLAFAIQVEPEGGPFWLHMTGRPGVKDFLQAEMDLSSFTTSVRQDV